MRGGSRLGDVGGLLVLALGGARWCQTTTADGCGLVSVSILDNTGRDGILPLAARTPPELPETTPEPTIWGGGTDITALAKV